MGFMDKMKAANGMNFGRIESPDFPCGVLILKNGQLTIINAAMNGRDFEKTVRQSDIRIFKFLGCGGTFSKYYIEFKDGKSGVITQEMPAPGSKVKMAPVERYIKIVDPQFSNTVVSNPLKMNNASNGDNSNQIAPENEESNNVEEYNQLEENETQQEEIVEDNPVDDSIDQETGWKKEEIGSFRSFYDYTDEEGNKKRIKMLQKVHILKQNEDKTYCIEYYETEDKLVQIDKVPNYYL